MDWAEVGKGLLNVAPALAGALGGPPGLILSGAINMVRAVVGVDDNATPEIVQAELAKLTPEQYAKVREADNTFKAHLVDAGVNLEEIAAGDRKSAREMYDSSKIMTNVLAGVIIVGWLILNYVIFAASEKFANMDLILRTLGTLDMAVGGVIYFFFGSSAGSDKLKNIIANSKES